MLVARPRPSGARSPAQRVVLALELLDLLDPQPSRKPGYRSAFCPRGQYVPRPAAGPLWRFGLQGPSKVLMMWPLAACQITFAWWMAPPPGLRGTLTTTSLLTGAIVVAKGGEIFGLYPLARPAG